MIHSWFWVVKNSVKIQNECCSHSKSTHNICDPYSKRWWVTTTPHTTTTKCIWLECEWWTSRGVRSLLVRWPNSSSSFVATTTTPDTLLRTDHVLIQAHTVYYALCPQRTHLCCHLSFAHSYVGISSVVKSTFRTNRRVVRARPSKLLGRSVRRYPIADNTGTFNNNNKRNGNGFKPCAPSDGRAMLLNASDICK